MYIQCMYIIYYMFIQVCKNSTRSKRKIAITILQNILKYLKIQNVQFCNDEQMKDGNGQNFPRDYKMSEWKSFTNIMNTSRAIITLKFHMWN